MAKILIVDDDAVFLDTFGRLLRLDGHDVLGVETARDGLRAFATFSPEIALLDLCLPDMSGIDLTKELMKRDQDLACVIITGFGTCQSAVEAMRAGAFDFIEKPIIDDELSSVIQKVLSAKGSSPFAPHDQVEVHSAKRWANSVVRVIQSPADPRTLKEWGRAVGASAGALRNWCRTAGISARRSLLFARVLRAVVLQHDTALGAQDLLDVVDRRTLIKILRISGASDDQLPSSADEFLRLQTIVDNALAVNEVRAALMRLTPQPPGRPLVSFDSRASA